MFPQTLHGACQICHHVSQIRRISGICGYPRCLSSHSHYTHTPTSSTLLRGTLTVSVSHPAIWALLYTKSLHKSTGSASGSVKVLTCHRVTKQFALKDSSVTVLFSFGQKTVQILQAFGWWSISRSLPSSLPINCSIWGWSWTRSKKILPHTPTHQRKLRHNCQTLRSTRHPMSPFCMSALGVMVTPFEVVPFAQFHSGHFQRIV